MDSTITQQFRPRARIDFITIGLPASIKDERAAFAVERAISGRINAPKKWRDSRDDRFTIHDPTLADLQYLIEHYPDTAVLALEVAVDFVLRDGTNDPVRLVSLHNWLKTRLFPQRHERMQQVGRRKFYDLRDGTIKRDTLKTSSGAQSIYWQNPSGYEQVRLYIKTQDNRAPLDRHCVRLEATLHAGGCQYADVHRVAMLPEFGDRLRRYLSRFLYVAAGIKPKVKRSRATTQESRAKAAQTARKEQEKVKRAWGRYGAAWAAKHGFDVIPDAGANRMIGGALKTLRDDLARLVAPLKRAEYPDYETKKNPANADDLGAARPGCIEACSSSPTATPDIPDTTIGPSPEAQADRARAHRRSGGPAERADGQPFTQQTIERLFDINRDPVAFIESRGSTDRDDAAFLDNLLDEINALSDSPREPIHDLTFQAEIRSAGPCLTREPFDGERHSNPADSHGAQQSAS